MQEACFCILPKCYLKRRMLIPKLQFVSLSGIENQEKAKPEARKSGTHRLTIFNLVFFAGGLFVELE